MCSVLWDMTNVSAYSFPQWQHLTFSQYQNENFLSPFFCQTFGLLGVIDLWLGVSLILASIKGMATWNNRG